MPQPKRPTLAVLATRIGVHLERMERDPMINAALDIGTSKLHPFWRAHVEARGNRIFVQYQDLPFRSESSITREKAEKYLAWLDAGNNGKHWEVLRK